MCNHNAMTFRESTESVESSEANPSSGLTVLYDGACPLCRGEIGLYQKLEPRQPVRFLDVTTATSLPEGLSRDELLARFHVLRGDGRVESGARAFLALWAAFPGWRWLARVGRLPGVIPVLELAYRGFLHIRPAMQRLVSGWTRRRRRDL